jgi:hypothetical protein
MDNHLTADVRRADYLVDLSNVLKDTRLGGTAVADLHRLDRAIGALARRERDPNVLIYPVADESLLVAALYPDPAQPRTLRRWRQAHLLDVVGDADPQLLELHQMTGIPIVTGDRFTAHRDQYPELQGSRGRLIEIVKAPGGRIETRSVHLEQVPYWKISRSQENDQWKQQGLVEGRRRDPRYDIIDQLWRCPHPGCAIYDGSAGYLFLPRFRNGAVVCDLHGERLTAVGHRPVLAQIKVLVDGACVGRFGLPAGPAVPVGRAPGRDGVDLVEIAGEAAGEPDISRVHLKLHLRDQAVYARDVSTNGTEVQTPGHAVTPLPKDAEHAFVHGETLLLSPRMALTRSGRRFPSELTDGRTDARPGDLAPPTRRRDLT